MVYIFKKGLIAMISIAMVLTMFPLVAGSSAYAADYNGGDGLNVIVEDSILTVDVVPNSDELCEYDLFLEGEVGEPVLPDWAAEKSNVKEIVIGEGTMTLGTYSFKDFNKVERVCIPKSVFIIGEDAFAGCTSIQEIWYGGTENDWEELINSNLFGAGNDVIKNANVECCAYYRDLSEKGLADINLSTSKRTYTYDGKSHSLKLNSITWSPDSSVLEEDHDYTFTKGAKKNVGNKVYYLSGYNRYMGGKSYVLTINPKGTAITGLTNPSSKKIKVTWKKQATKMSKSRIDGYQVKIATNSKFTKGVKTYRIKSYKSLSKTIKVKKSGKKYYVKVRTYKNEHEKNFYSKWSKVKSKVIH